MAQSLHDVPLLPVHKCKVLKAVGPKLKTFMNFNIVKRKALRIMAEVPNVANPTAPVILWLLNSDTTLTRLACWLWAWQSLHYLRPPISTHSLPVHPVSPLQDLSGQQIQELESIFRSIDTDGNGEITLEELTAACKDLGTDVGVVSVCACVCVCACVSK